MPLEPSVQSVLNEWLDERLNFLHTAMPGKFKSYDAATQTAEVVPVIKQSLLAGDDSRAEVELPVIPNVKVHWPKAGGFYWHFPIAAGDYCQLIFNEAAIGFWRANGTVASPGDLERHGLSHPYAYPGGWPDSDPLPDAPSAEAVIIVPGGKHLRVSTASGVADAVALAQKVATQFDQLKAAITSWVPVPMDGGAALKTALATFASSTPTDVKAATLKAE
jgi:hypothetical protein